MTESFEMGVGHWSMQSGYAIARSPRSVYQDAARHARLAEEAGFDSFWLGEHHFSYDGYCPSLTPAMAFLASATKSITLATSVTLLPFHNAQRVAESCAALDDLAPGRGRHGMGLGYRAEEFLAAGLRTSDRVRLYEEHMDGLVGDYSERLGRTQIWSGFMSGGKPALRAARYGASLALPDRGVDALRSIREEWQANFVLRDDPGRLLVMRDVWVDRDPRFLEWIRGRMTESWRHYSLFFVSGSPPSSDAAWQEGHKGELGQSGQTWWDAPDLDSRDEMAEATAAGALLGSPEQVVDALAPLVNSGVIDGYIFRIQFGGIGPDHIERCMGLLAEEVVPVLRSLR
ncbi:MAG: hypothetical protein JWN62_833 [Acidimicrobiales bacterium]|nr:hypothetical protein [Acidimicrobiales bacterium]